VIDVVGVGKHAAAIGRDGGDVEARVVDEMGTSRRGRYVGVVEGDDPRLVVADTSHSL
jgi:hypothetical protein